MAEEKQAVTEILMEQLEIELHRKAAFERNWRAWDEALRPSEEGIRRSEILTEDDLAIRINVRDDL